MELTEAQVRALRMSVNRACQAEGPEHHDWLHDTIRKLVSDRDQLTRIVQAAAPYTPIRAFEENEAEDVRSLRG